MNNRNTDELSSLRYVTAMSGLPALTGVSPTIEQARTIRVDLLIGVSDIIASLRQEVETGGVPRADLNSALVALQQLRDETPAVWWVAHRDTDPNRLLQELTL
jgi:hypothetical protein